MRLSRPVLGVMAVWLAALTVLAVWPAVGDAPWEHADGARLGDRPPAAERSTLRCEDALARRRVALAAMAAPRRAGDQEYSPGHRQAVYSPTIPAWTEAERQLKAAQDDIDAMC